MVVGEWKRCAVMKPQILNTNPGASLQDTKKVEFGSGLKQIQEKVESLMEKLNMKRAVKRHVMLILCVDGPFPGVKLEHGIYVCIHPYLQYHNLPWSYA